MEHFVVEEEQGQLLYGEGEDVGEGGGPEGGHHGEEVVGGEGGGVVVDR